MNLTSLVVLCAIGLCGVAFAIFDHRREQARRRRNPAVPSEIEWTVADFRQYMFALIAFNVACAGCWGYFYTLPPLWVKFWPAALAWVVPLGVLARVAMPIRSMPLFEARDLSYVAYPFAISFLAWCGIWVYTLAQSPDWKFF